MGLDVTHIMLTLTPSDEGDNYTLDDWSECNVPLVHYEKFITKVKTFDFNKSIIIAKNEHDAELILSQEKAGGAKNNILKMYTGKITPKLITEIERYIVAEKLDKLERLDLEITSDGTIFMDIGFADVIMEDGFYYEDIGSLRKGMNEIFYDKFREYILYGRKDDFEKAYQCVGSEWHNQSFGTDVVNKMRIEFKKDFVDKFIFGQSLLNVSF